MKPDQERLSEQIEHFLMEREVLTEHMRKQNERLKRGEVVLMTSLPIAPIEHGFKLLEEAARQLTEAERALEDLLPRVEKLEIERAEFLARLDRAERYREALTYYTRFEHIGKTARRVLSTADSPESAPESTPKSCLGEEAGGE